MYANSTVYCVVREPVARFLSVFEYASSKRELWPSECGELNDKQAFSDARTLEGLACFVGAAKSAFKNLELDRRLEASFSHLPPDLQMHLQPQHSYVTDRDGNATCDIVFNFEILRNASLRKINSHRTSSTKETLAMQASLVQDIRSMYQDDIKLWNSLQDENSAVNERTSTFIKSATAAYPRFMSQPPICWSKGDHRKFAHDDSLESPAAGKLAIAPNQTRTEAVACTCSACCSRSMARPSSCIECILGNAAECGGPGPQSTHTVPRAFVPLCKPLEKPDRTMTLSSCNVCDACCNQTGIPSTGKGCVACELERCPAPLSAAAASDAPADLTSHAWSMSLNVSMVSLT